MELSNCSIFDDENETELIDSVTDFIKENARKSIEARGCFLLGYSGGSLAAFFAKLSFPEASSKWHLFPVDERIDSEETNYHAITEAWSDAGRCTFHQPSQQNACSLEEIAGSFEAEIKTAFTFANTNRFDLLLLGLGPDGHTASLFPKHPDFLENLSSDSLIIGVRNSPKPPSTRISMSPKLIKSSGSCAFIITKSPGKTAIIKEIIRNRNELYPPTIVAPHAHWFLDRASSQGLQ